MFLRNVLPSSQNVKQPKKYVINIGIVIKFFNCRLMIKFNYRKGQALFTMMRRMALEPTSSDIHCVLTTKRPKKNLVPSSGYIR
jgi:hypothetical protein